MRRRGEGSAGRGREGEGAEGSGTAPLQLTEEEKAVLVQCRRNSTARGLMATTGSVVLLRAIIRSGRAPLHLQTWSSVYYTTVAAVSFLAGLRSYRQSCLDKIMSLEHSILADQLRQHRRRQQGWTDEDLTPNNLRQSPLTSPSLKQPDTVSSDTPFSSDSTSEQPEAFGSNLPPPSPLTSDPEATPTRIRGRTFDEIRSESRRRQQKRHSPQSNVGGVRGEAGKPVHVRRNKYGDIISED